MDWKGMLIIVFGLGGFIVLALVLGLWYSFRQEAKEFHTRWEEVQKQLRRGCRQTDGRIV